MRPAACPAFSSVQYIRTFCEVVEDYGDLMGFDFAFATFCHDLALVLDDFTELGHRKVFENERFLVLIAELLDEFDEGLVLFVQTHCWAEKEDALKQGLPAAGNVEVAEDIE